MPESYLAAGVPLALALLACLSGSCVTTNAGRDESTRAAVEAALEDFHDAASRADGERYFAHFTPDAVFIGTDPKERWSLQEFQAYARPYFDKGQGWTYVKVSRHVALGPARDVAWFDERLRNESYGLVRGSGVLVLRAGEWRIAQYNLGFEVPNELSAELVRLIRSAEQ